MHTRLIASPRRARAARSADAVDVVLGSRQLEVHDVRQRLDVEAARRDVGRDEDADSPP